MKLRSMRALTAVAVVAALVLTGCSGESTPEVSPSTTPSEEVTSTTAEDAKILEGITYAAANAGEAPTDVKIEGDFTKLSAPAAREISPGTGETVEDGDLVSVHIVSYSAAGETTQSTYDDGAPTTIPNSAASGLVSQLLDVLTNQKIGARLAFAAPSQEEDVDPNIMVMEIVDSVRPWATGEPQEVTDASLPTVTLDDSGQPSIEIPDGFEATDDTQTIVLKQGDGAEVKETDYLHAQYSGWNLQGEQFDSSWERGATTGFSLQQVIQGWTKGLAGQKLGSQVMLIIPAEQAYGAGEGNNESGQPLGDLIFVVDLLAVN